ncbi:MAG: hypothetical protein KKB37_07560, partial [Alphaproteobacteria bacterium]|nr:hypothetical protein [Alphaproteobacteria bacterium]
MQSIPNQSDRPEARILGAWLAVAALLTALAIALVLQGEHFAWERQRSGPPALALAAGMMLGGLVYLLLWPLISWTLRANLRNATAIVVLILATGLLLRVIMIPSVPALEDDFYRYLWDGAVAAAGFNPYVLAPETVATEA